MPAAAWWDVLAREYHAEHSVIGSSMAKLFRRSPLEYFLRYECSPPRLPPEEQTDAEHLGILSHLVTLQPERIETDVILEPKVWNRRSPKDRAERNAWIASLEPGKVPATDREFGTALKIAAALRADPWIAALLERDHMTEAAVVWECAVTGLPRKAMFDVITEDWGPVCIGEIKVFSDYPQNFRSAAIRFDYPHQAAWYQEAAREIGYVDDGEVEHVTIVVRPEPPFEHLLWRYSEQTLEKAAQRNREAMIGIWTARQTGIWQHPRATEIQTLDLPDWAIR